MTEAPILEVMRLIAAANAARWLGEFIPPDEAEQRLEALFHTGETLAVYGTLAPGQPNHHIIAHLGGEWTAGVVEGDLFQLGWGAAFGYPAFRPRPGGPEVAVKVLRTAALPAAWPEIDRFEGPEYRRILVPVYEAGAAGDRRVQTVANLYASTAMGTDEVAG